MKPPRLNIMTREQAIPYISVCVDNALNVRSTDDMPNNARLIGWQCGFEPMFVAVWSYLTDTQGKHDRLEDAEAIELAVDLLQERKWFAGEPTEPNYVI
jgi:hypothetical protein